MVNRINPTGKDNPRWPIGNTLETLQGPGNTWGALQAAALPRTGIWSPRRLADAFGSACGILAAWLTGLPRRAGRRLYTGNDEEARTWSWRVTERFGGLGRRYGDARFEALRRDPSLRRDELRDDGWSRSPGRTGNDEKSRDK
jgi:hypothetical protein